MTFEIEADPAPPEIGAILADASQAQIQCNSAVPVDGHAAHGSSMKSALEPLIEHFGLELFDDGDVLRSPSIGPPLLLTESDLGCSAGSEEVPRTEQTQVAARSLPSTLTLSYYDASREYQASQMRGSVGDAQGREDRVELPAVLNADAAKAMAETELARIWARRDRLTLRLPPRVMVLKPGSTIELAWSSSHWTVEQAAVEGMAVVVQLRPRWQPAIAITADSGRALPSRDEVAVPTTLALIELPEFSADQSDAQALYVAATSNADRWRPIPIEIDVGGTIYSVRTAVRRTVLGTVLNSLPATQALELDLTTEIDVQLVCQDQWIESCDDEALAQGRNLCLAGSELIQFGIARLIGAGNFRLSRLLRGRRGSEWAMDKHAIGETFVLLDPSSLLRLELPNSIQAGVVRVRACGLGDANTPPVSKRIKTARPFGHRGRRFQGLGGCGSSLDRLCH